MHRERNGAGERNRTPDRLITNQLLYLLSYASHDQIGADEHLPRFERLGSLDKELWQCNGIRLTFDLAVSGKYLGRQ